MMQPISFLVFIACVFLVPAVTARHKNFRRQVTCDGVCTDDNQDACCSTQLRCCTKTSDKVGRCPSAKLTEAERAQRLGCVFDGDCPADQKCCQPKQYCMVAVDAENSCPRIRVFGEKCDVCTPAGREVVDGNFLKRCCPDGLKGNRGVCMPPFIIPTPPAPAAVTTAAPVAQTTAAPVVAETTVASVVQTTATPVAQTTAAPVVETTAAPAAATSAPNPTTMGGGPRAQANKLTPGQMFCVTFDDAERPGDVSATIESDGFTKQDNGSGHGDSWNKPAKR